MQSQSHPLNSVYDSIRRRTQHATQERIVRTFVAMVARQAEDGELSPSVREAAQRAVELCAYQDLISQLRPALIIEVGAASDESAAFLGALCEVLGHGHVISVDGAAEASQPQRRRVTYLRGSSTDPANVQRVRSMVARAEPVLLILATEQAARRAGEVLDAYVDLMPPGSHLIVEGTPDIDSFIGERTDFVIEPAIEGQLARQRPRVYARRSEPPI